MRPKLKAADLFCGGGGTSTGADRALRIAGFEPELTAINHWPVAIATHTANHPSARHLCTSVDDVDPRQLYGPGELFMLWASPECTHHSRARGGTPVNEQSRATGHCVTRWAEALLPPVILVENVPEFLDWGPLMRARRTVKERVPKQSFARWQKRHPKGNRADWQRRCPSKTVERARMVWVPDPARKGATFRAWVGMLKSLGYRVEHRILCCADYGDPTTRERLFVQAVRGKHEGKVRRCVWPDRTHAPASELTTLTKQPDLFTSADAPLRPWVAAREIIDWDLPGRWLDEMPGKAQYDGLPLSPKTLRRIQAGLQRYGLKPYIVPGQTGEGRTRDVAKPLQTVTTSARDIGLVQPFVVSIDHASGAGIADVEDPLSTVTSKQRHCVAEPFLVQMRGTAPDQVANSGKSMDDPLGAVTAGGGHHAMVSPFLVPTGYSERDTQSPRAHSVTEPMPTVVGSVKHGVVQPYLVQVAHGDSGGDRSRSLDAPLNTVCGNRGDMALVEPFLLGQHSGSALRPASEPAPTITCGGAVAMVEPYLIRYHGDHAGRTDGAGRGQKLDQPITTVDTQNRFGLVDPYLIKFYGTGTAASVAEPLDTVTTKERFGLVQPEVEIDGQRYRVRLRWRMLQLHELQLAQGFPATYRFAGTKTEGVKQVGNAVPGHTAAALVLAAVTQKPDVSALWQ